MALALTEQKTKYGTKLAGMKIAVGNIAFDDSYPTGGESLTPANVGLGSIDGIVFQGQNGYSFEYDYVNQTVKVFTAQGTQVANEGNLSALTKVKYFAWGW